MTCTLMTPETSHLLVGSTLFVYIIVCIALVHHVIRDHNGGRRD